MRTVLAEDLETGLGQLLVLDASGKSWDWSGKQTKKWAGHQCTGNYSVAGEYAGRAGSGGYLHGIFSEKY